MAKLKLTKTEKVLVFALAAIMIFTVANSLTTVSNPTQVQSLIAWIDKNGVGISNIQSATVSGTINALVDFYPTTYIGEDGATYTFSACQVDVYQKSGSNYSATVYKTYTGVFVKTLTYGGHVYQEYKVNVDTTLIPNGDYKFVLNLVFQSSGGGGGGGGFRYQPLSTFYASFSTGTTNGNNGGANTEPVPVPVNYTILYLTVGLISLIAVYELILKKKR